MLILIIPLALLLGYIIGYIVGGSEEFEKGYNQGKLSMAAKLDNIKSCDRMIEKILREKYMDES